MKRVVITGLGAVSPIGNTVEELWSGIKNNVCGIEEITHFDTIEHRTKLAAEVKNLDYDKYFAKRDLKFNDQFTKFARIAAKQAYEDAGFTSENIDVDRLGVIFSSGVGGLETMAKTEDVLADRGPSRVSPYFIPMTLINLAAGNIAIDIGAKGPCTSVVTACAAGTDSIGEAFLKIKYGQLDAVFAGGSEAAIIPLAIAGFASMRALSEQTDKNRASVPFDKERSGFVMGEGGGVLVLEELEHAKKRGAKIYAELVGYGSTCDANHITSPSTDGSGAGKAMLKALAEANLDPSAIEYINAHGTSTPLNDKSETLAVKYAFKDHYKNIAVSSTKSNTGHLLGASGAIEAIITTLAVKEGYIPPTINHKIDDPECDLNVVKNTGFEKNIKYAMSNSLGFGGHNASIIFKKWEE